MDTGLVFSFFALFKILLVVGVFATAVILVVVLISKAKKNRNNTGSVDYRRPQKEPVDRRVVIKEKGAHYDEERKRILTMIDNGRISADEAERLFNALERETTTMDCPFCGGEIRIEAKKCKHCGAYFKDPLAVETKRLTKSRDQVLCGVCAGLAEYLALDPFLVRILTIAVVFTTGIITGLVVYFIAAMIIPDPE